MLDPVAASQVSALNSPVSDVPGEVALPDRPLWDYPATYALIALNLAVYGAMYRSGPLPQLLSASPHRAGQEGWQTVAVWVAGLFSAPFSAHTLTLFGACTPQVVLSAGEWWRLLSSLFVHVTLLHLLLNLWCLWNLGVFGEPLLGKAGLFAVYLLTGAAGMLGTVLSAVLGGDLQLVAAGASGAIFGIAGILIVLLSNRRLGTSWEDLRFLRLQVVFFAVINLALGGLPVTLPRLAPGMWKALHIPADSLPEVANWAHLGGLVCGLILGALLFPRMTSGRSTYRTRQAWVFGSAALVLALASYALAIFARGTGT